MNSIRVRFILLVAATVLLTSLVITLYFALSPRPDNPSFYRYILSSVIVAWQRGEPELRSFGSSPQQGFIIAPDGTVAAVFGDLACGMGDEAGTCGVDFLAIPEEGQRVEAGEVAWYEFSEALRDGWRAVGRVSAPASSFALSRGYWEANARYALRTLATAIGIALLLSLPLVRPLVRRLEHIARTSQQFAAGDLTARTGETRRDEVGRLAQQFDQMADTLSAQVHELRQLLEENSRLALTAERNARLDERLELARDLHDAVSQHLFSLAMGTADLAALIRRQPEEAAQQAEELAGIAAGAQDELRIVLKRLRPSPVAEQGLVESLAQLAEAWRARAGVALEARFPASEPSLPALVEDVLYRVCQEGLNNVARHAAASRVGLTLALTDHEASLTLADDGRGFDPAAETTGLGLIGMRERVRSVGGALTLQSGQGSGTRLQVQIPIAGALAV